MLTRRRVTRRRGCRAGGCAAAGFWLYFLAVPGSRAEPMAYEPFVGGAEGGPIVGMNGGAGFGSAWAQGGFNVGQSGNFRYAGESLQYDTLPVQGGRLSAGAVSTPIAGIQRTLAVQIGYPGTTVYLSVLLRPEGRLHGGAFNGFFGLYLNTGGDLYIGKPGGGAIGEYVIEDRGGVSQVSTGVPVVIDQTVFLVLKAAFGSQNDVFTLHVNPPPVPVEPAGGIVRNHQATLIQGLTIYATGGFSMDELRIGATYADVAPFPPPSLLATPLDGGLQFTWDAPGFNLQQALGLEPDVPWTPVPSGDQSPAWVESLPGTAAFYRLTTLPSALSPP